MRNKTKKELSELLEEALEIIWRQSSGPVCQKQGQMFLEKLKYDYYNRKVTDEKTNSTPVLH